MLFRSNGNRMGAIQYYHYASGAHEIRISDKKNNSEAEYNAYIKIGYNSSGVPYTNAVTPVASSNGESIATTQWVKDFAKTSGNNYMSTFSQGANGYYKFTNGLIIQWGVDTTNDKSATVTLPTAFTSTNYNVSLTAVTIATTCYIHTKSTTDFSARSMTDTGFEWIAIGY